MKNLKSLLCLSLLFGLCACSSGADEPKQDVKDEEKTEVKDVEEVTAKFVDPNKEMIFTVDGKDYTLAFETSSLEGITLGDKELDLYYNLGDYGSLKEEDGKITMVYVSETAGVQNEFKVNGIKLGQDLTEDEINELKSYGLVEVTEDDIGVNGLDLETENGYFTVELSGNHVVSLTASL